jgi:hypothetical protein
MLENVTCQIVNSSDWWNYISLLVQLLGLLGSLIIAFFTVQYTQYLREKREYNAVMVWFLSEGFHLVNLLVPLKDVVNEKIQKINAHPNEKNIEIMFFPDCTLNSFNSIISKGYFKLLKDDYIKNLIKIQLDTNQIKFYFDSFTLLNSMASEVTIENFNAQQRGALTNMLSSIDTFVQDMHGPLIIDYPKTFIQWILE